MTLKSVKLSRKSKRKKHDKIKMVKIDDNQQTKEGTEDEPHLLDSMNKKEKSAKQVHIAFLQEKYEPLIEEEITDKQTDDCIKKKQDKYKKFRKNMGKALRFSWKCLVVGLQNFSTAYSMPLCAAATVVPEIHRARPHV
ncbi:required for drug-induced death protein 1 [Myxocyprinus asiaticus]|uniref:required for drug-induced death protein 1 n=1 Tax=Myxocyprinus asiaticus TaxID=70543 RepID=UPI002222BB5A|nr:required for drug-induced death protein 1 [Myxocyprinus asiaticus]